MIPLYSQIKEIIWCLDVRRPDVSIVYVFFNTGILPSQDSSQQRYRQEAWGEGGGYNRQQWSRSIEPLTVQLIRGCVFDHRDTS